MNKPIYNLNDRIYMRFFKDKKVLRVARFDPLKGFVLALYTTDKPGVFSGDAFHEIDDNSPRTELKRENIEDKVWLKLLDGDSIKDILSDYQPEYIGVSFGDSFHYCKRKTSYEECREYRTFHISADTDENEMLERLEKSRQLTCV